MAYVSVEGFNKYQKDIEKYVNQLKQEKQVETDKLKRSKDILMATAKKCSDLQKKQ